MKENANRNIAGFSLLELVIAMSITLALLAAAGAIFSHSIGTRESETRRTQAIIAAQNTLNLISREVANSGYGLTDNGLWTDDSDKQRLHFRANINNSNATTNDADEDLVYYFDKATEAVIRYDSATKKSSTVANHVSAFSFQYWDYTSGGTPTYNDAPSENTARVRVSVTMRLEPVAGQANQEITYTSDITLRNSTYISSQY